MMGYKAAGRKAGGRMHKVKGFRRRSSDVSSGMMGDKAWRTRTEEKEEAPLRVVSAACELAIVGV